MNPPEIPIEERQAGWRRPAIFLLLLLTAWPFRPALSRQKDGLSPAQFRGRLEALLANEDIRRAVVGISIVRLNDNSTVAEVNPGKLLHPASNMKLFTTAAALALLPRDFSIRTELYCDGAIDGMELGGNLYVAGGGDPLLDTLDLDSLAGIVAATGIRRITGDLVADVSLFDTISWGKGWMWDDEPDPDEAFIAPMMFNHAAVSVVVRPGPRPGTPAECVIFPGGGFFRVENRSTTVAAGEPDSLLVARERGSARFVLEGTLDLSSPPETTLFSVRNPPLHFLHYLRERLASKGIDIGGTIRTGDTAGPVYLGRIERGLGPVLSRINTNSDNIAAECLLKIMAARISGAPGTSDSGLALIASYLGEIGIDPGSVIAADGSGVSWYNAVAPDDIVAVLRDQYSRKETFREFYGSLARPGYDGTLGSRLSGTAVAGRIAAKTGSLTGVSTLSGYLTTMSNELLAFSIMINHFPGKIQRPRSLQDSILLDLVRLSPGR